MSPDPTTVLDVVIIGAGFYGLTAAKTYLKLEPQTNLTIIESDDSVGGVWSKKRIYPNLVAQVPHGLFNYPDHPMPKSGETDHHLVTGFMIQHYLEKYAEDYDLLPRIRFNTWVETAERCPRGWRLKIGESYIETTKLIVATGLTSVPNVPSFKVEKNSIPVIHSRDIAANVPRVASDDVQGVVVVGAAKSAYDAVYLLCSMGKRVTWIIRPDGAGPMPIMPAEMFGINTISIGSTRLMNYLSPSLFNSKGFLADFFYRTALGRWLTNAHWRMNTRRSYDAAGFDKGGNIALLKPEMPDRSTFWCDSSLGLVTLDDFWTTLKGGNLKIIRDNIDTVGEKFVSLRSGEQIQAEYIFSCTGWGDHFSIFSPEMKAELGIPSYGKNMAAGNENVDFAWEKHDLAADKLVNKTLPLLASGPDHSKWHPARTQPQRRWRLYNRTVPLSNAIAGDRSLVILGQIHTTQTPTISEIQSFWSVLYLLGEVSVPNKDSMIKEVAEWNAWTRKRYASCGQRYPYALFDWIPYLDKLLGEAGVKSRRKGNFVSELLSPYGPHTYDGYLDEYLAKRAPSTFKETSPTSDSDSE
ncbi:hypothetical protein MMC18_008959 [Xylographa bjoerkii]|nr:hypothetical protein [Xylographa bjoerkii]